MASSRELNSFNFTNFELIKNYPLYIKYASHPWIWIKGFSKKLNVAMHRKMVFPLSIFRGCPSICSYCGGNRISQELIYGRKNLSIRSAERVVNSIEEAKRYGYDTMYIPFLYFKESPLYFHDLFQKIKENKIEINAFLECWMLPTEEIIREFKKTFLPAHSRILISPECAIEKTRCLNKTYHFTNKELIEILEFANEIDIIVEVFFTIGLPFETMTDMDSLRNFQSYLKRRFNNVIIRTNVFELEPATPMYLNPDKYNIVKNRDSLSDFYRINNPNNLKDSSHNLGYCNSLFSNDKRYQGINGFAKAIQEIRCKYFCLLADYLADFVKVRWTWLNKILYIFALLLCRPLSFYWKYQLRRKKK